MTISTLSSLLATLDRAQLQALLIGMAARDPALTNVIERQVALLQLANSQPQAQASGDSARISLIDQQAIRQQLSASMQPPKRGRYDDYNYYDDEDPGGEVVQAVRPLLEQARGFVNGGDALSALEMLEPITSAYLEGVSALNDRFADYGYDLAEGTVGEFFGELAEVWAEAFLSADLSPDEREIWIEKIADYKDGADDTGAGAGFELAFVAADQGWDYPPLLRAFAGEVTELGAWEGERPDYADDLALIRLKVLERQGRREEYLHLAEAEGQTERYIIMLAKVGRTREAIEEGLKYLISPSDLLGLAKALQERGELAGAQQIAEHGMALKAPERGDAMYNYYIEANKAPLALWAADLAASMGDETRALHAMEVAFRAAPSLDIYRKTQAQAGERWATVQPGLLDHLRHYHSADAKVDIFLHEGMIDDAIAAVKDGYGYDLLERVMDAALMTRPDWVIKAATAQAERIMDAGKAQEYDRAVAWLRRAHDGFRAAARPADWQTYLSDIRTKHGRKYKLIGLLKEF